MQSLLLMCVIVCIADELTRDMRWVDHFNIGDKDIYFDRVVAVSFDGENTFRAAGLLITKSLVLTTYNPFRTDVTSGRENMNKIKIIYLKKRQILVNDTEEVFYVHGTSKIACGRQVLPTKNKSNVWHMQVGEQSPLHDLMVFKLKGPLDVKNKSESDLYEFDIEANLTDAGPIVSLLASRWARLGDDLKFASYGHIDRNHIESGKVLRSFEFEYDDHVLTDCDEWLPRGWGNFICLNNIQNFPAIASGAVLVHKDFVYGLGSFFLEKGEEKSILVFTDLRPYLNLIYNTCQNTEKKT